MIFAPACPRATAVVCELRADLLRKHGKLIPMRHNDLEEVAWSRRMISILSFNKVRTVILGMCFAR